MASLVLRDWRAPLVMACVGKLDGRPNYWIRARLFKDVDGGVPDG